MKNTIKFMIGLLAIGLVSCEPEFENAVTDEGFYDAGDADFSNYVSLGNSLTAGYADGALYRSGQEDSYPNIMAEQFGFVGGGDFTQPLTSDNLGGLLLGGQQILGNRLVLSADENGNPFPTPLDGTPTTDVTTSATGPFNNMGVPGAKSYHLVTPGYGSVAGVAKQYGYWMTINYRESYGMFAINGILFNHESILRDERWLPMKIIMGAIRIKLGKADRLYLGSIDASRDWSSAEDIVDGLYAIMSENAVNEDFVLGSGKVMKVSDLLDTVFTGLDLNWHDYVEVDDNHGRSNDHIGFAANISKAKKLLNWEPRRAAPEWTSQIKDFHLNLLGKNL